MVQLWQKCSQNTCILFSWESGEIWVQKKHTANLNEKQKRSWDSEVNWERRRTLLLQANCVLQLPASVQKCWVQDGLEKESWSATTQQEFVEGGDYDYKIIHWDPLQRVNSPLLVPPPTTFVHIDVPSSLPKNLSPALKRKKVWPQTYQKHPTICPPLGYNISYIYTHTLPPNTRGRSTDCSFQLSALSL